MVPQHFEESVANAVRVLQDLVVPEPDHANPPRLQPAGARLIACAAHRVLAAVDFHRQPFLGAQEIDHIGPERMLSAKLVATEPPIAQPRPQPPARPGSRRA